MTNRFSHKRINVTSQGPDGHVMSIAVYEVTGLSGGRSGFIGCGSTLEDAVIDAMRAEAAASTGRQS